MVAGPPLIWAVVSHHTRRRVEIPVVSVGSAATVWDCFEPCTYEGRGSPPALVRTSWLIVTFGDDIWANVLVSKR
jgi:hypothetical protein